MNMGFTVSLYQRTIVCDQNREDLHAPSSHHFAHWDLIRFGIIESTSQCPLTPSLGLR